MKRLMLGVLLLTLAILGSALPNAQGDQRVALYNAIRSNDLARLRTIVRTPAEANLKDEHGNTPLIDAAAVGSVDAMTFLLGKGAEVNAQNDEGLSPLMLASSELPKMRLLLDRGADVNLKTKISGRT